MGFGYSVPSLDESGAISEFVRIHVGRSQSEARLSIFSQGYSVSTVQSCIARKSGQIFSLPSSASVLEALQMMRENRIRAVLVMDNDVLIGIVSQGDCAIRVLLPGRSAGETLVSEIMTRDPLTVTPQHTIDHCMKIMMTRSIRHLPVIDAGRVSGMVSIGDVVKDIMQQQGELIKYLETYIKGHAVEY